MLHINGTNESARDLINTLFPVGDGDHVGAQAGSDPASADTAPGAFIEPMGWILN